MSRHLDNKALPEMFNHIFDDDGLFIYTNDIAKDIAAGNVADISPVDKFGETGNNIDSADGLVTVWDGVNDANADKVYTYPATATIDTISSSSASDTEVIEIQGLDANYVGVVQNATLNGQTKVVLATPLMRVFRMKNEGSADLVGTVYCYEDGTISGGVPTTNSTIKAIITIGHNQTLMAIYTVAAGCTGYLYDFTPDSVAKVAGFLHGHLLIREFGGVFQVKRTWAVSSTGSSAFPYKFKRPLVIPEKSDIEFVVESSANNMGCGLNFSLDLETN